METEKIIKGNRLIAEFMGGYQRDRNGTDVWDAKDWQNPLAGGKYVYCSDMEYNSNWQWLMPVVDKIEQFHLGIIIKGGGTDIINRGVEDENIPWLAEFKDIWTEDQPDRITGTWQAVVQFIIWYNQFKKVV